MSAEERSAVNGRVFLDASLYGDLQSWIRRHYRRQLCVNDLSEAQLAIDCRDAFCDLAEILDLPFLSQSGQAL
jgi:succinylarginine dihydrolase